MTEVALTPLTAVPVMVNPNELEVAGAVVFSVPVPVVLQLLSVGAGVHVTDGVGSPNAAFPVNVVGPVEVKPVLVVRA